MAQNITLLGASYSAVPAVTLPKTGGGTAQFDDTTDADATASDILQGKTAYVNGVKLTGTGSGGGGGDAEDGIIARTISGTYENSRVTAVGTQAFRECKSLISASFNNAASIGSYAFEACTSLTTATFPSATFISAYAFGGCTRLATISFPIAKTIGNSAFNYCSSSLTTAIFPSATNIGATAFAYCYKLATISFPKVVSIQNSAFQYCSSLTTASFPNAKTIGNQAFRYCSKFESLYLLSASMATLGTNVFLSTPMSNSTYLGYFGSIYVPSSLVSSYQTATNWMAYSARITSYVE